MSSQTATPAGRRDANVKALAMANGASDSDPGELAVVKHSMLLPADSPRTGGEDIEHIRALAELTGRLPPIVVHRSTMRVIDGMHRLQASVLRGERDIEVRFFDGTAEEAFVLAVQSNSDHGLPLSQVDRSAAASRILNWYPHWSDVAVAAVAGISDKTVAALRERSTSDIPKLTKRVGRDGRIRPVDPAEGRLRASDYLAAKPNAPIREIAKAAGVAPATANDVRKRLRNGQDPLPSRLRRTDAIPPQGRRATINSQNPSSPSKPEHPAGVRNHVAMLTLRNDPSLRLTDDGRAVLRLLDAHRIDAVSWSRLADSVPPHCGESVIEVARGCVQAWTNFIRYLEQRS